MAKQPIYVKIMSDIENQIKDETLKSGDQVPTEKELCELYNTSRMTVNKAISRLCEKNLVERIAGKRVIRKRTPCYKKTTTRYKRQFFR